MQTEENIVLTITTSVLWNWAIFLSFKEKNGGGKKKLLTNTLILS